VTSYPKACVLLALITVTLSACGSSPAADSSGARPGSTAAAPPAADGADATKLCDFLRGEIPVLTGVGSEVGRLAQLTVHLYSWGEEQKVVGKMDVEQLTMQSCPDVRAEVLTLIGEDSFDNVF
jgi:hypothetical protein